MILNKPIKQEEYTCMYSHSVRKNENTLYCNVGQIPTNDVKMVVGGNYRGCL